MTSQEELRHEIMFNCMILPPKEAEDQTVYMRVEDMDRLMKIIDRERRQAVEEALRLVRIVDSDVKEAKGMTEKEIANFLSIMFPSPDSSATVQP